MPYPPPPLQKTYPYRQASCTITFYLESARYYKTPSIDTWPENIYQIYVTGETFQYPQAKVRILIRLSVFEHQNSKRSEKLNKNFEKERGKIGSVSDHHAGEDYAFCASFCLILRHRKHLCLETGSHISCVYLLHNVCTDHYYRLNYQLNRRTIAGRVQII